MAEPTKEEVLARIAELEKQVATKKAGKLEFKVSEKGGVSVYGLGRFPVTLYAEPVGEIVGRRGRAADICRGREAEGDSQAEEGLRITGIARSREDGSWRFYSRLLAARPQQQRTPSSSLPLLHLSGRRRRGWGEHCLAAS